MLRAVLEVLSLDTALFAIRERLYLYVVTKHFQHPVGWFCKLVLGAQLIDSYLLLQSGMASSFQHFTLWQSRVSILRFFGVIYHC